MNKIISKYVTRKKDRGDIEGFLLANKFVVHDISEGGKKVVYNKNMQTLTIHTKKVEGDVKKGSILFDVNGVTMFNINFIPSSVSMFEYLIKESLKNNNN